MRFFHNYFFFSTIFYPVFCRRGVSLAPFAYGGIVRKKKQPDRCRGRLGCFFPGFFFGARFNLAMLIRIS